MQKIARSSCYFLTTHTYLFKILLLINSTPTTRTISPNPAVVIYSVFDIITPVGGVIVVLTLSSSVSFACSGIKFPGVVSFTLL